MKYIFSNYKSQVIFSIISFIIFVLFCIFFIYEINYWTIKYILLFLLPLIITIVSIILNEKQYLKKFSHFTKVIFCITSFIYYFFVFIFYIISISIYGFHKVNTYYRIYEEANNYIKDTFVNPIPKNAKNIKFHYNTAFLQGGAELSLYFKIDANTLKNYKDKYDSIAKWHEQIKNLANEYDYISSYFLNHSLSNEFLMYYIDGECDKSGYCNHGYYKGVGINEENQEIIFIYENW